MSRWCETWHGFDGFVGIAWSEDAMHWDLGDLLPLLVPALQQLD